MRALTFVFALLVSAAPLAAQAHAGTTPHQASRGWIPLDSLVTAVGITASQRADVSAHHAALDSIMRVANEHRTALMARAGQPTDAEVDSLRAEFEHIQEALDTHYEALVALLSTAQRDRLSQIRRPRVLPGSDH